MAQVARDADAGRAEDGLAGHHDPAVGKEPHRDRRFVVAEAGADEAVLIEAEIGTAVGVEAYDGEVVVEDVVDVVADQEHLAVGLEGNVVEVRDAGDRAVPLPLKLVSMVPFWLRRTTPAR